MDVDANWLSMPLPKWRELNGIKRSTWYTLPANHKPRTIMVGEREYVTRAAHEEWARRGEAVQAA